MIHLSPTAADLAPAPLDRVAREEKVRAVLVEHGIFPRRWGHASNPGITITYAHLAEAADGSKVAAILADHLPWEATEVAFVAGAIAVTTLRG